MSLTLTHIYRHPVKGLSPEPLERVALTPGLGLPQDRRFAIGHGRSGFDPAAPVHVSKSNFLMLARNEKLARLKTRFNDAANILTVEQDGLTALQARLVLTQEKNWGYRLRRGLVEIATDDMAAIAEAMCIIRSRRCLGGCIASTSFASIVERIFVTRPM